MALTPEDVVNKRFTPTRGRKEEGYDQDEVDDFLDEIVVEFRRLTAENDELRKAAGGSADAPTSSSVPGPVAASTSTEELAADNAATGSSATSASSIPDTSITGVPADTSTAQSATGVLAMAQRLHDEYVNAGVEQRDKIIAEAQLEATGLVSDAEDKSRKTLGELEEQRTGLERKVEQLRSFERDYRSRLKSYIEGQLRDLDARGSIASDASAT